jgi:hypothetical protein
LPLSAASAYRSSNKPLKIIVKTANPTGSRESYSFKTGLTGNGLAIMTLILPFKILATLNHHANVGCARHGTGFTQFDANPRGVEAA